MDKINVRLYGYFPLTQNYLQNINNSKYSQWSIISRVDERVGLSMPGLRFRKMQEVGIKYLNFSTSVTLNIIPTSWQPPPNYAFSITENLLFTPIFILQIYSDFSWLRIKYKGNLPDHPMNKQKVLRFKRNNL